MLLLSTVAHASNKNLIPLGLTFPVIGDLVPYAPYDIENQNTFVFPILSIFKEKAEIQLYSDQSGRTMTQPAVTDTDGSLIGYVLAETNGEFMDLVTGVRREFDAVWAADVGTGKALSMVTDRATRSRMFRLLRSPARR